ncbi:MAG: hypothetical protein ABSC64_22535 [Candidatus Korobacteraceae bacterium]
MERQVCPKEGYGCPEETRWSQADERSYAEEIVGDDESKVGAEKEDNVTDELFRTSRTFAGVRSSAGVL